MSIEHAGAGRIPAAIQELEKATQLRAGIQQLAQVKQAIVTALLQQAKSNLQSEQYDEALSDCDKVLELGGTSLQVTPIRLTAWNALADLAVNVVDLDKTLLGLKALQKEALTADPKEKLCGLYFRSSRLPPICMNLGSGYGRNALTEHWQKPVPVQTRVSAVPAIFVELRLVR